MIYDRLLRFQPCLMTFANFSDFRCSVSVQISKSWMCIRSNYDFFFKLCIALLHDTIKRPHRLFRARNSYSCTYWIRDTLRCVIVTFELFFLFFCPDYTFLYSQHLNYLANRQTHTGLQTTIRNLNHFYAYTLFVAIMPVECVCAAYTERIKRKKGELLQKCT